MDRNLIRTLLVDELKKRGTKRSEKWIKEAVFILSIDSMRGAKTYGMNEQQKVNNYLDYFNI